MLDAIDSILREQCGLDKAKPLLVGVSGGPDSLCLLSMLHEAGWKVIAAHFNHMLRPEADQEAAAVEALAREMSVPFVGERGNVKQYAEQHRLSIEAAARELRYRFLFGVARAHEAQAVAVGHTADDQVETVLMHFLRGAGLNGLKGMAYRSVLQGYDAGTPLVRPLLDIWRRDTVDWCASRGLMPQYDRTNESSDYLRNRLRNELIPLLEQYNPRFRDAVWRTTKTLAADQTLLIHALGPVWQQVAAAETEHYVALHAAALGAQSAAAQVHLVQRAARRLMPALDIGYDDLQRAARLIADPAQERLDLGGGLILLREGSLFYIAVGEAALPLDQWPQMPQDDASLPLPVPGEIQLPGGWRVQSALWKSGSPEEPNWERPGLCIAHLDARTLTMPLELRVRRDGDRFQPLGMDGHSQKLSDFMTNVKMPRRARAHWPLVCAGESIVWIPGYQLAHPNRLRGDEDTFVELRLFAPPPFTTDFSASPPGK